MNKLKKFFNSKAGQAVKSIGLGALKGFSGPVGGMVAGAFNGVKNEILDNVDSETGGQGQIDWIRLLSFIGGGIALVYLTYSLFTGSITFEDFLKMFESVFDVINN